MGTAADTLVSKHPTRISQLKGPVRKYLLERVKELKLNGTEQDLYMAVFHPKSRRISPYTLFPADVRHDNPGINTPQDYINRVNATKIIAKPTGAEYTALKNLADEIGTTWQALSKMINFESGWDPKAKNRISGARGLIQFMPSTAEAMGYKKTMGTFTKAVIAVTAYWVAHKMEIV